MVMQALWQQVGGDARDCLEVDSHPQMLRDDAEHLGVPQAA